MAMIYEPQEFSRYKSANVVPYRRDPDSRTYNGSFGAVYKVSDSKGKVYAVKEIHAEDNAQRQPLTPSQILSEINILSQCQHQNVLRVVDTYCVDTVVQTYFIVTEPWAPVTLQAFFRSVSDDGSRCTNCPWWQPNKNSRVVLQLFRGLIEGLAYLHKKSIFHKDIKPENLLLSVPVDPKCTEQVIPIIADLVISKFYRPGASTKFTNSTVQYLAPEQIHHRESGLKADIFAMGCCSLLLFAAAHSGGVGLRRVEEVVIDPPGSCQYGREIGRILPVVQEMLQTGRKDLYHLGTIIQSMIHEDPNRRPDAESLRFSTDTKEHHRITPRTRLASPSVIASVSKAVAVPLAISQQDPTTTFKVCRPSLNSHSTAAATGLYKLELSHSETGYSYSLSKQPGLAVSSQSRIQRRKPIRDDDAEHESRIKKLEELIDNTWTLPEGAFFVPGYHACYSVFTVRRHDHHNSYDRVIKQVQGYVQASTTAVKASFEPVSLSNGEISINALHIMCSASLTCFQQVVWRLSKLEDLTMYMVSTFIICVSCVYSDIQLLSNEPSVMRKAYHVYLRLAFPCFAAN
jgi:serine/threonine protein kinase